MRLVVDILELLLDELRIDLRRADIGMAEHLLDGTQICSVLEQMCCE